MATRTLGTTAADEQVLQWLLDEQQMAYQQQLEAAQAAAGDDDAKLTELIGALLPAPADLDDVFKRQVRSYLDGLRRSMVEHRRNKILDKLRVSDDIEEHDALLDKLEKVL